MYKIYKIYKRITLHIKNIIIIIYFIIIKKIIIKKIIIKKIIMKF
jgi:hypothetical protein